MTERLFGKQHRIQGEIETTGIINLWIAKLVSGTITFTSVAENDLHSIRVKNLRVRRSWTGRRYVQSRFEEIGEDGKKRRYRIQCPIELED